MVGQFRIFFFSHTNAWLNNCRLSNKDLHFLKREYSYASTDQQKHGKMPPLLTHTVPLMKFADLDLNPRLLQNLNKQGFETATKAQQEGLPVAFAGKDLLMSADTGSGKTLAFMVPAVNKLLTYQSRWL
jgi:superfamily II DNA/RNA helicase